MLRHLAVIFTQTTKYISDSNTTIPNSYNIILENEDFISWKTDTHFIEKHFISLLKEKQEDVLLKQDQLSEEEKKFAEEINRQWKSSGKKEDVLSYREFYNSDLENPWNYNWETEEEK